MVFYLLAARTDTVPYLAGRVARSGRSQAFLLLPVPALIAMMYFLRRRPASDCTSKPTVWCNRGRQGRPVRRCTRLRATRFCVAAGKAGWYSINM